jgi:hypothetical protein
MSSPTAASALWAAFSTAWLSVPVGEVAEGGAEPAGTDSQAVLKAAHKALAAVGEERSG